MAQAKEVHHIVNQKSFSLDQTMDMKIIAEGKNNNVEST